MNTLEKIVTDSVYLPSYELSRRLARVYPHDYIMETEDWDFDLREFHKGGQCRVVMRDDIYSQFETDWVHDQGGDIEPRNAMFDVFWRDCHIKILRLTRIAGEDEKKRHWLFSPHAEDVKAFFSAVCRWNTEVRSEVLVFARGHWEKDTKLYDDIKKASFADLVMPDDLRIDLAENVRGFFDSKLLYESYGIAWKRGVLLMGPPGNGKTHTVKALINLAQKPCLYVRSFKASRFTEHDCIGMVFNRARKTRPCVLVFEDLDSMVDERNRSYFLNELDGFASNDGILVLATTNYPEKLDPAIVERPSRFDRKFTFELPAVGERRRFIESRNVVVEPDMRLSEGGVQMVSEQTEGFSFAYLKELWLSSMMAWMARREPGSLDGIMQVQVANLRGQMKPEVKPPVEEEV